MSLEIADILIILLIVAGPLKPAIVFAMAQFQADLGRRNRALAACIQRRGYVVW